MNISSLILIGASTGGPGRIYSILSALDQHFEGTIVIAQHMCASFIPSFVTQLQTIVPLPISSVEHPIKIERGTIYVCSVTSHLFQKNGEIWLEPMGEGEYHYNPQIDRLFSSASLLPRSLKRLGVILTGIGDDGAEGSLELYESGGDCLFESEESAIVYGMPRRAKELVCNGNVGSIEEIIERIKGYGDAHVRMV
ncbi:CheB methylesterase domain-containing protein [Sulfuricurvum sp.]|uniref:CheB methylesterase domain-containing protein n=1 Tax=Sulfuricurvum sp. TaxID=2025608 RepID=UPI002E31A5EE|nr:CheB methylesterase domain-containing protein [Sulfuricurvum sp.]HEX5329945.1 CheB methylesterase domain-containing protein [Sulfuricurvum sp.]